MNFGLPLTEGIDLRKEFADTIEWTIVQKLSILLGHQMENPLPCFVILMKEAAIRKFSLTNSKLEKKNKSLLLNLI